MPTSHNGKNGTITNTVINDLWTLSDRLDHAPPGSKDVNMEEAFEQCLGLNQKADGMSQRPDFCKCEIFF